MPYNTWFVKKLVNIITITIYRKTDKTAAKKVLLNEREHFSIRIKKYWVLKKNKNLVTTSILYDTNVYILQNTIQH